MTDERIDEMLARIGTALKQRRDRETVRKETDFNYAVGDDEFDWTATDWMMQAKMLAFRRSCDGLVDKRWLNDNMYVRHLATRADYDRISDEIITRMIEDMVIVWQLTAERDFFQDMLNHIEATLTVARREKKPKPRLTYQQMTRLVADLENSGDRVTRDKIAKLYKAVPR